MNLVVSENPFEKNTRNKVRRIKKHRFYEHEFKKELVDYIQNNLYFEVLDYNVISNKIYFYLKERYKDITFSVSTSGDKLIVENDDININIKLS